MKMAEGLMDIEKLCLSKIFLHILCLLRLMEIAAGNFLLGEFRLFCKQTAESKCKQFDFCFVI